MVSQDLAASCHPYFNTRGADIVLSSLNGTSYHLSSSVLRRTATFFASSSFTFGPDSKPTPIHEHDVVLERLLQIPRGLAIPPWCKFDDLQGVITLAEIWGSRSALDIIRASITAPIVVKNGG
ncbi:hypothetical protein DFS33DRAFT_1380807 [Desarmillaria ectypa]|nr:hypothetical protein DFS33DRAFT_1380807 [Desarmillaria ectypa]